jgi:hypothetical protein
MPEINAARWPLMLFIGSNVAGPILLLIGFVYIHHDSVGRFIEPASRGLDDVFRWLVIIAYAILAIMPCLLIAAFARNGWAYVLGSVIPCLTVAIVLGSFASLLFS